MTLIFPSLDGISSKRLKLCCTALLEAKHCGYGLAGGQNHRFLLVILWENERDRILDGTKNRWLN